MIGKSIWHYYLIVPLDAVAAADTVAPALANPDGIVATFQPSPEDAPRHYWADFVACDLASDGAPSKQALEGAVSANAALASVLFVRTYNDCHPSTTPEQVGGVVASNWAAFPVGATVSNTLVVEALGAA